MTAVAILLAQSGIVLHRHLRRFHQQHAQHAVALLGDRTCDVLALTIVFHRSYIPYVEWQVEHTHEFGVWRDSLSYSEHEELAAKVRLLQELGPALPRQHADTDVSYPHSHCT